ncbi:MAG: tryptophan--tRNA ligase [bacterium]|nr:tryptophan--tRNA ligase [bacterium]
MNLKQKIEERLQKAGVEYRLIPLPENIPLDIASHVQFHKIQMKDAVATLIYHTEKGLIAVQRRADTKTDEKKLREVAGIQELHFATEEDLRFLSTTPGIVPLTGLDIPFFTDKKVLELPKAYCGAGVNTLAVTLTPQDLIKVNNATVGDFTYFEKSKELLKTGGRRLLSGITPSGDGTLHIGNYLGAVKQFISLARDHECFLMVADLHALTTIQNRQQLQRNTETLIRNELALLSGFLTEGEFGRLVFFRQSDVPMHTELQTILNNVTPLGLIKRAHAYKDKLSNEEESDEDINMGLFCYPILMAADILLYKPDLVPVGKDQKQHIEITRDIAHRFNSVFRKSIFRLPEPHIPDDVAVVLGTDGKRKMSKSLGNIISIFADEELVRKQVMGTYTDPTRVHATDQGHIEGNMVFSYLDFFGQKDRVDELKNQYRQGKVSDVAVKEFLFESLMSTFRPARVRYEEYKNNPAIVEKILRAGANKAQSVAEATMKQVREAVGLAQGVEVEHFATNSISIDQFSSVDMRVGKVSEARNVDGSDKLIRLVVDTGEEEPRVIFTGVRPFGYTPEDFEGKQFFFVTNLSPRKMPSFVETAAGKVQEYSQGMIMAVDSEEKPLFLSADGMPVGAKVR